MFYTKLAIATAAVLAVAAQDVRAQETASKPMESAQATALPEECGSQQGQSQANGMPQMNMSGMDMSSMDDAHRALMKAMMKMGPAMMQGIMSEDPDMAFICGMIAHHQGAIDMGKAELQDGSDEDAKEKAQKVIDEQMKQIAEYKNWVEEHQ